MTQPDDARLDQPDHPSRRGQDTVPTVDSTAAMASILDGYMADLRAGMSRDRGELLAAYPAQAAQLEACLAGIEFVHRVAGPAGDKPAALGEFQIVRELGRGGMGVVYEAEQTSLHRRVALKVLRFGAVADIEAMRRFRREAETVARLHHTNIVPIFAVGCERDVHYYAMQYIAGQSLADVLAEARQTGKLLRPLEVAGWGRQAAEALAHAHERGVIHRDIKPSNLLLDKDGIVWLTDFGLAKRADLATLTVSGALMGTPRYMSPEQAEALKRPVDHRTDLYSLGATLYELATGRPVFEAATPHGVIARILNEQPERPRHVRPGLPRDLETIILTCLAKDPSERYQTAQALADDLRAILDGRPIRARRAPLNDRMTRYVRKRKKAIGAGSMIVAATTIMIVGSFLGWRSYRESRLGRVLLSTDGSPLTAQVVSERHEEPIGEPFTVGTRTVESLPADQYRLRVDGPGILSRTYRFGVDQDELGTYRFGADENRLLGQELIPYSFASGALVLASGKADFVEWTGQTLIRRDGVSGKPVWDASRPAKPWGPKRDPVAWMRRLSYLGDDARPASLIQPAPDVDGDGTADMVWAFRVSPSLLALSGKDGSMLWTYSAQVDSRGGPDPHGPEWPESIEHVPPPGRVLGSPYPRDLDGDGILDLVAAFTLFEDGPPLLRGPGPSARAGTVESDLWAHRGRRVVAAVSGRSGQALWSHPIDPKTTTIPKGTLDRGITLIDDRGVSTVAFVADDQSIRLDPANGQPRGQPIALGFVPVRPAQYADLDGDGETEVLALGPGPAPDQQALVAFSGQTGGELWAQTIPAKYESPLIVPAPDWPLIVDLDGDGRSEIVVADSGPMAKGDDYRGVRLLDGATGRERWVRPLHPTAPSIALLAMFKDGLARVIDIPDLDGDGTRELVAVSRYDGRSPFLGPAEPLQIFVDALSGKDGHSLWWWHSDFKVGHRRQVLQIGTPFLWGGGGDGWPMVVVPLGGARAKADPLAAPADLYQEPARVHLLSVADGRELHTIDGLSWPRSADVNGDGRADLWGSVNGNLRAYRGEAPEAWRVLGRYHKAADLDGDGIADIISDDLHVRPDIDESSRKTMTATAHSGRDARLLWRTRLDYQGPWLEVIPESEPGYTLSTFALPGGDLDGDGVPEISVIRSAAYYSSFRGAATLPLEVLSGKSGRPLWSAGPLPLGFDMTTSYSEITSINVLACEPRGPMDIIVRHHGQFVQPRSGMVFPQDRLARLSGRDGHVNWDIALADGQGATRKSPDLPRAFGDFDGDGHLDICLLVRLQQINITACERRALSLRDGKTLWSHAATYQAGVVPTFAAGDVDADGQPELIVRDQFFKNPEAQFAVTALDGRDGSTRWTWHGGGFADAINQNARDVCLADFEGKGASEVCVNVRISDRRQRVAILDAMGKERVGRDLNAVSPSTLTCADLDGDGHDELLFLDNDNLRAVGRNLENVWCWPTRELIREVIPAGEGHPAVVVLDSMIGLDGATGRPLWDGHDSTVVLDAGDSARRPRLLSHSGDATVCRLALPTTPEKAIEAARGAPIPHLSGTDDPRWIRPLPWNTTNGVQWARAFFGFGAIAFVSVVIPLAILKLATRRRVFGVPLLIAMPVAVAIPLAVAASVPPTQLLARSLAGLPVVVYLGAVGLSILKRRWRRLAVLVGLTVLATVALAVWWLWSETRGMTAIEHFNWSGWYLAVIPGAYAVGVLACIVRLARSVFIWFRRNAWFSEGSTTHS